MRQHAATAYQQVQLRHLDDSSAGNSLVERIAEPTLFADTFERHRKRLVLHEGETQGLTRYGLLNLQILKRMRHGRGPDHLVLDAIAQIRLTDLVRHPTHDRFKTRLSQHVGNTVAHT